MPDILACLYLAAALGVLGLVVFVVGWTLAGGRKEEQQQPGVWNVTYRLWEFVPPPVVLTPQQQAELATLHALYESHPDESYIRDALLPLSPTIDINTSTDVAVLSTDRGYLQPMPDHDVPRWRMTPPRRFFAGYRADQLAAQPQERSQQMAAQRSQQTALQFNAAVPPQRTPPSRVMKMSADTGTPAPLSVFVQCPCVISTSALSMLRGLGHRACPMCADTGMLADPNLWFTHPDQQARRAGFGLVSDHRTGHLTLHIDAVAKLSCPWCLRPGACSIEYAPQLSVRHACGSHVASVDGAVRDCSITHGKPERADVVDLLAETNTPLFPALWTDWRVHRLLSDHRQLHDWMPLKQTDYTAWSMDMN